MIVYNEAAFQRIFKTSDVKSFLEQSMPVLLPCPFCGFNPDLILDFNCCGHGEYYATAFIRCTNPNCRVQVQGCIEPELGKPIDDVFMRWNRRKDIKE